LVLATASQAQQARVAISATESLYRLRASASLNDQKQAQLPEALRNQVQQYQVLMSEFPSRREIASPPVMLGRHRLLMSIGELLGSEVGPEE